LAILPLLLLVLPGCSGDSFESLRKKQVETVNEAIQVLTGIRDRDSAEKARPTLKKLGDRWRDLDNRISALENVSADEQTKAKPLSDQLDSLIAHYLGEALRVAFVPGGKDALAEIGEVKKRR
jgi:hypothetical protein